MAARTSQHLRHMASPPRHTSIPPARASLRHTSTPVTDLSLPLAAGAWRSLDVLRGLGAVPQVTPFDLACVGGGARSFVGPELSPQGWDRARFPRWSSSRPGRDASATSALAVMQREARCGLQNVAVCFAATRATRTRCDAASLLVSRFTAAVVIARIAQARPGSQPKHSDQRNYGQTCQ